MKTLRHSIVLFIIAALLLAGCASGNGATPTETFGTAVTPLVEEATASPLATPTKKITALPTDETTPSIEATDVTPSPVPTAAPTAVVTTPQPLKDDDDITNITTQLIDEINSSFNSANSVSDTKWGKISSPTLSISDKGYENTKCLYFQKDGSSSVSYYSAALDLKPYIKTSGYYTVNFKFKVEQPNVQMPFYTAIRTTAATSFSKLNGSQYYGSYGKACTAEANMWYDYEMSFSVSAKDASASGKWNFCLHMIAEGVTGIYIDNFTLTTVNDSNTSSVIKTETYQMSELVLLSDSTYNDPYRDVDVSLKLTNGTTTYNIPGFWDGGNIWRVRFYCPTAGTWSYKTTCTNTNDSGLHNVSGDVAVKNYSGTVDLYKHGFVTTEADKKYFVYADGTPFFYLGDTHWNVSGEPLTNIKTIVDKRVSQGFTVIQSEPLGAVFDLSNGVSDDDIPGLRINDLKFEYIAENGLTHANSQFFFPSLMTTFLNYAASINGLDGPYSADTLRPKVKDELERLTRYWVARYSAMPVMWTLGQEIDDDFYGALKKSGNPYIQVARFIEKYDAYSHPLTGHQENTGALSNKPATNSLFNSVNAHTWYGVQWSPSLTGQLDVTPASDCWSSKKVAILYEGRYCYLWTKNFGARAQGWDAYLSGMYGYGWGGQDTWSYLNTYDEANNSSDGIDTITSQEKKDATWRSALEYESTYQMGYMRKFFENTVGDWWNLIPRFNNTTYFSRSSGAFSVMASNSDNSKLVIYFYNFSDKALGASPNSTATNAKKTGTVKNLTANATYSYQWFNPVTGKVDSSGTFKASSSGTWSIGDKASGDMVLYITK